MKPEDVKKLIEESLSGDEMKETLKSVATEAADAVVATLEKLDDKSPPVEEKVTEKPVVESTPNPQLIKLSSFLLRQTLSEAKLPEAASERIKEAFDGRDFDEDKLSEAIKKERDYLASLETTVIETHTSNRGTVTKDAKDKFLHRLEYSYLRRL